MYRFEMVRGVELFYSIECKQLYTRPAMYYIFSSLVGDHGGMSSSGFAFFASTQFLTKSVPRPTTVITKTTRNIGGSEKNGK